MSAPSKKPSWTSTCKRWACSRIVGDTPVMDRHKTLVGHPAGEGFSRNGATTPGRESTSFKSSADRPALAANPPGADALQIDGTAIYRALDNNEQCQRLNAFMGKDISLAAAYDGCPPCEGIVENGVVNKALANWPGCTRAGD